MNCNTISSIENKRKINLTAIHKLFVGFKWLCLYLAEKAQ
jgi:hypothetical protein